MIFLFFNRQQRLVSIEFDYLTYGLFINSIKVKCRLFIINKLLNIYIAYQFLNHRFK